MDNAAQINIFMKEYGALREEVLFHLKEAKLPAKYLQVFVAGTLVIIYYLLFVVDASKLPTGITNRTLLIYFLPLINFTSYYFAFDILDSYHCIILAGSRLRIIEEEINKIAPAPILIWEKFQSESDTINGPSRLGVTIVQIGIIFLLSFALPLLAYVYLWLSSQTFFNKAVLVGAMIVCLTMFPGFIYASYDVLKKSRNKPYEAMRALLEKQKTQNSE